MGSILKSEWQYLLCRKLFGLLAALDTTAKQEALAHFISPLDAHGHAAARAETRAPGRAGARACKERFISAQVAPFDPDFNITAYRPKAGKAPTVNCPAARTPNGAWYEAFAPGRTVADAVRHGVSLNGMFAAPRAALRAVPRAAWGALLEELSPRGRCCEGAPLQADHFAERLWRPLLLGAAPTDASPQLPWAGACPRHVMALTPERLRHVDGDKRKADEAWRRAGSPPPPPPTSWRDACAPGWEPAKRLLRR